LEQIIQSANLIIHKLERFLTHSIFNQNQHDMDWSFFAIQDLKPIPKRVLHMNLETTRLRGRPRNRLQDEVREDGRTVGGEGWQVRVYNSKEWKKLLGTARNHRILHMPME
jgi:hypothetical protein